MWKRSFYVAKCHDRGGNFPLRVNRLANKNSSVWPQSVSKQYSFASLEFGTIQPAPRTDPITSLPPNILMEINREWGKDNGVTLKSGVQHLWRGVRPSVKSALHKDKVIVDAAVKVWNLIREGKQAKLSHSHTQTQGERDRSSMAAEKRDESRHLLAEQFNYSTWVDGGMC